MSRLRPRCFTKGLIHCLLEPTSARFGTESYEGESLRPALHKPGLDWKAHSIVNSDPGLERAFGNLYVESSAAKHSASQAQVPDRKIQAYCIRTQIRQAFRPESRRFIV